MGRKWNGIELQKRLGGGFSSDVYSVVLSSGQFALKLVDLEDERPPHSVRNEIKILNKLKRHSNVCEMISCEELNGEIGVIMPQLGVDLNGVLKSVIKKRSKFGADGTISYTSRNEMQVDMIRGIMVGVLNGLEWIHSNGIIHRDINPNNIMFTSISDYATPCIIDFGISYQSPNNNGLEEDEKKYTDIATGFFKAPELLLSKRDYGPEVDMWALGIILAQLGSSTGRVPYEEDASHSDLVLLSQILRVFGSPPDNWEECVGLPSFDAMNRHFFEQKGVPLEDIVDNLVGNAELLSVFQGLTRFHNRMGAKRALFELESIQ